jgi:ABC-type branched-subunit amino acid transport system ATPase component
MPLKVRHVSKSFGDKEVLKDVSFELRVGVATVLVGANGSGKTTLFNILSGFWEPDQGEVILHGISLAKTLPHSRNIQGIGRTFQDLRLIPNLTVIENLLLSFKGQAGELWWRGLFSRKMSSKQESDNHRESYALLETCFIDDVAEHKAGEISYGQQKLLNLACCMANNSEVVLLDEPVAGVNPFYRDRLEVVLKKLKRSKALLIIEHNTDFIKAVADEILFLNTGEVTRFENYEVMSRNKMVQGAYV